MILLDVNPLVYAHREDGPEYDAYSRWLTGIVAGPEPFGVSEFILCAFIRIVTNPRIFTPPTPIQKAVGFCQNLLKQPGCLVARPGPRNWGIFVRLCLQAKLEGPLVSDAYLAALAIEHGCELVSRDSDFARFSGLRWRHPLAVN